MNFVGQVVVCQGGVATSTLDRRCWYGIFEEYWLAASNHLHISSLYNYCIIQSSQPSILHLPPYLYFSYLKIPHYKQQAFQTVGKISQVLPCTNQECFPNLQFCSFLLSTGSHYSVSGATVEKAEHNIWEHVIAIFQPSLLSD